MIENFTGSGLTRERAVFQGLTPTPRTEPVPSTSFPRALNQTMPILLVGSMAMAMNATMPAASASAAPVQLKAKSSTGGAAAVATSAAIAALPAPATYVVVPGDTVSRIAGRYGLSTSSVLALNGLGMRSLIFPGQVLVLTKTVAPAPVTPTPVAPSPSGTSAYTIVRGDTVSKIAARFGVSTLSVLTANGLGWSTIIYPGRVLTIPGQAVAAPTPAPAEPAPEDSTPSEPTPEDSTPAPETPTEPPVAETPAPPAPVNGSYTIVAGDTITKIAAKFGITIQAVLDANGLSRSSIIYTGRTLVIPGVATGTSTSSSSTGGTTTAGTNGTVTLLNDEQTANARTIIAVGRELGVPDYGIVIALATAMQESSMRNITYGHLDSVGLFQQRPSTGWGSVAQLTDASYAARLFYGGPSNPNKGKTRGLLDISGWQSMSLTVAAQKVQISAYPNAYAKWESSARFWFSELG